MADKKEKDKNIRKLTAERELPHYFQINEYKKNK